MNRRLLVIALVTLSLLTLAIIQTGCSKKSSEATVTRRDITAYLPAEGKVYAPATARADIADIYQVPVEQIYVTLGQNVKRGETLILFSAPTSRAYYQQARASLAAAQNALAQAKKQYSQALTAAQRDLANARATERNARLAASDPLAPPVDHGAITMNRQATEQAVIDAQARMNEGLVPYQQAVATAQEQFQAAQAGAKAAQVKSPIDGTVLAINAKIGVAPDTDDKEPLITVVNLEALKVTAGIPEERLQLLHQNDPAVVTIKEIPNVELPGSLTEIYSEKAGFLQGQKYIALVDFKNSEGKAKPGMDATVSIKVGEVNDVLAVPANAIYAVDKQTAVKLKEGNKWVQRIVETGLSNGTYTEIKSGLEEGNIVMTNP